MVCQQIFSCYSIRQVQMLLVVNLWSSLWWFINRHLVTITDSSIFYFLSYFLSPYGPHTFKIHGGLAAAAVVVSYSSFSPCVTSSLFQPCSCCPSANHQRVCVGVLLLSHISSSLDLYFDIVFCVQQCESCLKLILYSLSTQIIQLCPTFFFTVEESLLPKGGASVV